MNKIQQIWLDYKTRLNEKRKAQWMNFKSKLPAAVQLKLDKWEEWYSNYKRNSIVRSNRNSCFCSGNGYYNKIFCRRNPLDSIRFNETDTC